MEVVILFRDIHQDKEEIELKIATKFFPLFKYRSEIPSNSLVISRYSCLPYYKELEDELKLHNSYLINSYEQHSYIADITQWYEDVKKFTPRTYEMWANLPNIGKWVVKGKTNSLKQNWNTHMFADSKEKLLKIISNVLDDSLISQQGIVVRDYVPLKKLDIGINGLPITKEWRLFYYKENLLVGDFYWANFYDELKDRFNLELNKFVIEFANKIAKIVSRKTNFFVLDIAEKEEGGYILIEINDAQMSGLSCVDPEILYEKLKKCLI